MKHATLNKSTSHKITIDFVIMLLLLASVFLQAEDNDFELLLDEATEISTKNKINIDYTPGIVSIIQGEDLRQMGIPFLDANSYDIIPGFSRGFSRVSLDSFKYVVMINGMAINTQTLGINNLPRISTKAIKRIEVIRGPSSALYGANAFTSIINIVTYDDKNIVWLDSFIYGKSSQLFSNGFLLHQNIGEVKVGLKFQYNDSDGPDQTVTQDAASLHAQKTYAPNKLDNSMKNIDYDLMLEYQNFKLQYSHQYFGFADGYGMSGVNLPPKRNDDALKESTDLLELTYTVELESWDIETKLGALHYDIGGENLYITPLGDAEYIVDIYFKETNYYAGVEAKRNTDNHQFLVGGRYFYANLYNADYATTFNPTTNDIYPTPQNIGPSMPNVIRRISSLWVQDYFYLTDSLSAVANLRYDTVDDISESTLSPRFALIYEYSSSHILKAQYARAFMIPAFALLYGDSSTSLFNGYANLGMDKSNNYEFSYIYKQPNESLKTTLYYIDMYKVHTYSQENSVTTEYNNAIESAGVEIEYNKKYFTYSLKTNFAYNYHNKMKYLGTTLYEDEILPFPKMLGNVVVSKQLNNYFSSTLWYSYKGPVKQYVTKEEFDAENLLNLAFTYSKKISDNILKVTLSVSDIFDEKTKLVPAPYSYKHEEMIDGQQKVGIQLSYEF